MKPKNSSVIRFIVYLCALIAVISAVIVGTAGRASSADTNVSASPSFTPEVVQNSATPSPAAAPEPVQTPEPTPEPTPYNPYAGFDLTYAEKELAAKVVYNEARGESFDGQVAVVQVALNRCLHEKFPDDLTEVLTAPHQFSVGSKYTELQMEAVEAALAGYPALDLNTDVVFFSSSGQSYGTYYKTIGGHVFRTYS